MADMESLSRRNSSWNSIRNDRSNLDLHSQTTLRPPGCMAHHDCRYHRCHSPRGRPFTPVLRALETIRESRRHQLSLPRHRLAGGLFLPHGCRGTKHLRSARRMSLHRLYLHRRRDFRVPWYLAFPHAQTPRCG